MKKTKAKIKKRILNKKGYTPVYLVALVLFSAVALVFIISKVDDPKEFSYLNANQRQHPLYKNNSFSKFKSAEEFQQYIKDTDESFYYSLGLTRNLSMPQIMEDVSASENLDFVKEYSDIATPGSADRISQTNVQVIGIDEPDIVKTNGKEIYFSDDTIFYYDQIKPLTDTGDELRIIAPQNTATTKIIKAWPPEDLLLDSEIDLNGDLLLSDNNLLVFSANKIVAYDISNPQEASQKWTVDINDNSYLMTSRLYNNKVYLLTKTTLNRYTPCPIIPLSNAGQSLDIACEDIYHPNDPSQIDSTFTIISLDPATGKFEDEISFVGNQSSSNIYMSKEALYIAYAKNLNMFDFMFDFITTELNSLVPNDVLLRLDKLSTYDISNQSKFNELQTILNEWMESLDKDQRLLIENEMQNKAERYYEKNKRFLLTTGLVKIAINNLDIVSHGTVPGHLLNQFSMDEYKGYLRVATTIGNVWGWSVGGRDTQTNDVYVLDKDLRVKGSILDLGVSERIYAVRFIDNLAYLVTFRQIDPFYVLDLSQANDPQMVGELKIPGYSSYLHPLTDNKILGIGMENNQVKISYFDVSNPSNPTELSKYSLDEYGSEALYNHHAFLQDPKKQIFFLPSYKGGYIFSYANDQIELVRALSVPNVKRAIYLNEYMYILAEDYLAVLNENDWTKVNELNL